MLNALFSGSESGKNEMSDKSPKKRIEDKVSVRNRKKKKIHVRYRVAVDGEDSSLDNKKLRCGLKKDEKLKY